jgi:hypothetical protein
VYLKGEKMEDVIEYIEVIAAHRIERPAHIVEQGEALEVHRAAFEDGDDLLLARHDGIEFRHYEVELHA